MKFQDIACDPSPFECRLNLFIVARSDFTNLPDLFMPIFIQAIIEEWCLEIYRAKVVSIQSVFDSCTDNCSSCS